MEPSFESFLDDRSSEDDVRVVSISSTPSPTISDEYTPGLFQCGVMTEAMYDAPIDPQSGAISEVMYDAQKDSGSGGISQVAYDGFEPTWTNTSLSWLNAATIGQQFEQTLPTPEDLHSVFTELLPTNSSELEWLSSCNTDDQVSEIIVEGINTSQDYQHPQYRIRHEGTRSPEFTSVKNGGGSPVDLMVDDNESVNPSQATECPDNGDDTWELVWSHKRERLPERRPRSLQLSWRESTYTKRMHSIHNKECPICCQAFKRRDNIKPHVWRKHRLQYDAIYAMQRSVSSQSSPAPTTNLFACGKSSITDNLGRDSTSPTDRLYLEQKTHDSRPVEASRPVQCDIACQGASITPQKSSIDSISRKEPGISHGSKRRLAQSSSKENDHLQRSLACPFQKRNPSRHQRCFALSLQRIKDVKQHIYRCHTNPDYYCASCYEVFDTANDRDKHSRLRQCKRLENPVLPQFEGITEDQRKKLSEKSPRIMNVEEQWFQIWFIVFPNDVEALPGSVYLGNCLEEMVPLLRAKWEHQSSSIVARAQEVDSQQLNCAIHCAMDMFFKSLEPREGETIGCKDKVCIPYGNPKEQVSDITVLDRVTGYSGSFGYAKLELDRLADPSGSIWDFQLSTDR